MSTVQDIARHILPEAVYNALRKESQNWMMRCPCGHETSLWEMGALRWKADGRAIRRGRCAGCGEMFVGQVYRQTAGSGISRECDRKSGAMNPMRQQNHIVLDRPAAMTRLWIDGVGCWLLWPGAQLTLGGPIEPGSALRAADLCLMASLRRRHATFERLGETYRFETSEGTVSGRSVRGETYLKDGDVVTLGQHVQMRFRQPSVLSATAVLTPMSRVWPRMFTGSQTPGSIDGIVLMDEVCLLGPDADAHVPCTDWDSTVILHRRDGHLWFRTADRAQVDRRVVTDAAPLDDGTVVSGDGWRFRVESVGVNRHG